MKINKKMISIPPYISTSWNYVDGLYMKGATLVITLFGGESVNVPGLKPEIIEAIFAAHAESMEQEVSQMSEAKAEHLMMGLPFGPSLFSQEFPLLGNGETAFQFGISSMDGMGSAMEHNPSQADAPDLPLEILQKIGAIVKIVAPEEMISGATAIQNCNCPHCQITRAIFDSPDEREMLTSDGGGECVAAPQAVHRFQIQQDSTDSFTVIDSEDATRKEHKVFLGSPVSCTCGEEGCKHVIAVLRS
jgi:hypothetical protein